MLTLLITTLLLQTPPTTPTPQAMLDQLFEHYKSVQHFHVIVQVDLDQSHVVPGYIIKNKIESWKSAEKWRTEHQAPMASSPKKAMRQINCINGEKLHSFFKYIDLNIKISHGLHTRDPKNDDPSYELYNPVCIPIANFPTYNHYPLQDYLQDRLLSNNAKLVGLRAALHESHPCQVITIDQDHVVVELWLDAKNKKLVRKSTVKAKDHPYLGETVCEYDSPLSQSSAIPTSFTRRSNESGTDKIFESGKVTIVSVNQPLDPAIFRVANMNLPEGTNLIGDVLPTGSAFVKNGQLVPFTGENSTLVSEVAQAKAEEAARPRRELLQQGLLAAALGVALIGIYFLLRYFRQSKN